MRNVGLHNCRELLSRVAMSGILPKKPDICVIVEGRFDKQILEFAGS